MDFSFPYTKRNGEVEKIPFRDLSNVGPAGSINSTVQNMLKWMRLQLSDGTLDGMSLIKSSTLREMHTSQVVMSEFSAYPIDKEEFIVNCGMGWMIQAY